LLAETEEGDDDNGSDTPVKLNADTGLFLKVLRDGGLSNSEFNPSLFNLGPRELALIPVVMGPVIIEDDEEGSGGKQTDPSLPIYEDGEFEELDYIIRHNELVQKLLSQKITEDAVKKQITQDEEEESDLGELPLPGAFTPAPTPYSGYFYNASSFNPPIPFVQEELNSAGVSLFGTCTFVPLLVFKVICVSFLFSFIAFLYFLWHMRSSSQDFTSPMLPVEISQ
jgi:hypothetical protein